MVMGRTQWVVRLPSWLGDTVMAVPTIRALGRSVSRLVLWGPEANCRLLRATGVSAEILPYRRRRGAAGLLDMQRAVQALGALRPSGVVLLPNAYEPALLAKLARVRRRVGYATQLRSRLLTDPIPAPSPLEPMHESRRFAGLLRATPAGNPLADDWRLAPPPDAAGRARQLLGADGPILTVV
ncbi:MAG: glycosyltransferase family 9 protein, partial [Gammaproteobacteria bacterium]|nr:glycosyltransferase family 9 protein [Gammaproteobacteria bacterium]